MLVRRPHGAPGREAGMGAGTAELGGGWAGVVVTAVTVALVVVFHRLRDREVLAGDAREVFSRPLARLYLVGAVLAWATMLGGTAFLIATGRDSVRTSEPAVVVATFVLVLGWVALSWTVMHRIEAAQPDLSGPLAQLGRFTRVGYGSAAPAAWRRLRAGD